ncbi:MAG: Mur ligase domain-containing protein, partial [Patescibacteria group bacterium]|nr:Mur ligase domain-containing protein [Patescibacteria group bacterium]
MNIQGKKIKSAYFIGIKGVGMTMLAQFLRQQGVIVSGSDVSETFMTDKVLRDAGVEVFAGF